MPIIGTLLKGGIKLRQMVEPNKESPFELQRQTFFKLIFKAADTAFGVHHGFDRLLSTIDATNPYAFYEAYKAQVPLHDYNKIFNEWWQQTLEGKTNIAWPGRVKYFALSSGTSEATSKYIPVTKDMTQAIQKTSVRQILSLNNFDLPPRFFEKGSLMLGGSTELQYNGIYFQGDLSGIQASKIPSWFHQFYKPGKKIARNKNWSQKLDQITEKAHKWDIGSVVGVPAWVQILLEKIIDHYQVDNIHQIWPNLNLYTHGGVAFGPYRKSFEKLLGRPIKYIETYLASEGFIAFQQQPTTHAMQMVLDNGIFFEFIPFDKQNFDSAGNPMPNANALLIDQVEENKEYAIILNTCAGAWRYIIGDVIKFTNKQQAEIIITGRTKHYISLCGEHLSVDNMNMAIKKVSDEFDFEVKEFCIAGIPYDSLFAHHWYVGCDIALDSQKIAQRIDHHLKILNDDYLTERTAALKAVDATLLPNKVFTDFLKMKGKEGSQNKFPRVIKGELLKEWQAFLKNNNLIH